jgi:transcriptional regulator
MVPDKNDVLYGSLGMLVLQTLAAIGPLHGYRLARRIEQISDNQLTLNQGTLYPACSGWNRWNGLSRKWGESESGRRVKIYSLTRTGRKQLEQQESRWHRTTGIIDRFFKIPKEAS